MPLIDPPFVKASLTLTLLLVVALAVRQDLAERRISNVLTIAGFAAAATLHTVGSGFPGFLNAIGGAGVGILCFLPLYLGKGMGAGDVKLMGAVGAFLGPSLAFVTALVALVAGTVLALSVMAWRALEIRTAAASATPAPSPLSQLRKERFPYAAAIAAGAVGTMWWFGMLEEFIP